jgi:transposase
LKRSLQEKEIRDPKKFVYLIDWRIKADHDTIVKSLEGNWREGHLFTLRSGYELLKFHKQCIENCDKQIEQYLIKYEASLHEGIVLSDEEVAASETGVVGKSVKKEQE